MPEAATRLEPVAPQAVEAAVLPVPVAPTMKRKRPGKVAEADGHHAGLRDRIQQAILTTPSFKHKRTPIESLIFCHI